MVDQWRTHVLTLIDFRILSSILINNNLIVFYLNLRLEWIESLCSVDGDLGDLSPLRGVDFSFEYGVVFSACFVVFSARHNANRNYKLSTLLDVLSPPFIYNFATKRSI